VTIANWIDSMQYRKRWRTNVEQPKTLPAISWKLCWKKSTSLRIAS